MQDVQLGLIVAILPVLAGASSDDTTVLKVGEKDSSSVVFDVANTLKLTFATLMGKFNLQSKIIVNPIWKLKCDTFGVVL